MSITHSVTSDFVGTYEIHDTWTQAYVGVRHLIYELLPPPGRRPSIEIPALCQLGLVGANHLMEIGTYRYLLTRPDFKSLSKKEKTELQKAKYLNMFHEWIPRLAGWTPDIHSQPFKCIERLRQRRNDTVHKISAATNVPMCRSAIHSAVAGTCELWRLSGEAFPYQGFLDRHPLPPERPFSLVAFP